MSQRRSGFTLIELLVVIAIIAVLAALVIPIYEAAKEKAQTTKCGVHQKELMAALLMYVQDYSGRLPMNQFLSYTDWGGTAAQQSQLTVMRLYQPYVRNTDIIFCPALMAYAYNQCLYKPAPEKLNYVAVRMQIAYDASAANRSGRLLSQVARPGCCPAFFCAKRMGGKKGLRDTPGDVPVNGWGWVPTDAQVRDYFPNRHSGGMNYAFLDGHVRWATPTAYGYYMATDGFDYDGNGTLGGSQMMR